MVPTVDFASRLQFPSDFTYETSRIDQLVEVLETRRTLLGAEHADTLRNRNDVAVALAQGGETSQAIDLLTSLVDDLQRILGSRHPDTLRARSNLAMLLRFTGGTKVVTVHLEQFLADELLALTETHPDTAATQGYVAREQPTTTAGITPPRGLTAAHDTDRDTRAVLQVVSYGPQWPGLRIRC